MTKSKFVSSLVILKTYSVVIMFIKCMGLVLELQGDIGSLGSTFQRGRKHYSSEGWGDLIQGSFWFQVSSPPSSLPDCSERLVERSQALLFYRQTNRHKDKQVHQSKMLHKRSSCPSRILSLEIDWSILLELLFQFVFMGVDNSAKHTADRLITLPFKDPSSTQPIRLEIRAVNDRSILGVKL